MKKKIRHQYVFYESFHDALRDLEDAQYGRLMRAANAYALYGDEPELSDIVDKMVWKLIRPILEKGRNKSHDDSGRPTKNQTETKSKSNGNQTDSNASLIVDMDNGKDNEIGKDSSSCAASGDDNDNYERFRLFYNSQIAGCNIPQISEMTDKRKAAFDFIKKKYGGERIVKVVEKVRESAYLSGEKQNGPKLTIDWLFIEENFLKVEEGKYDDY